MRAEYYIDLIIALETSDESRKKIVKQIRKQFEKDAKANTVFDETHVAKSLLQGAVDVTTVLANISSLISPANSLGKVMVGLISKGKTLIEGHNACSAEE